MEFTINEIQRQILISGKLGDGNYKKNGKYNYLYRESHSQSELEYLEWKMNMLSNMITKSKIRKIKQGGFGNQQMYEFSTITSPTFISYANMSNIDAISELNLLGIILYYFDDGWLNKKYPYLSCGTMSNEECIAIQNKLKEFGIDSVIRNHNKYKEIRFDKNSIDIMKNEIIKYMDENNCMINKKLTIKIK